MFGGSGYGLGGVGVRVQGHFVALKHFLHSEEFFIGKGDRLHLIHRESVTVFAGQAKLFNQRGQQNLAAARNDDFFFAIVEFHCIGHHIRAERIRFEGETIQDSVIVVEGDIFDLLGLTVHDMIELKYVIVRHFALFPRQN